MTHWEAGMKSSQNPKEFKENQAIGSSEIMTLYHGSKSGIRGAIAPLSRKQCDFERGFIWERKSLSRLP